jgi:hypothetical protein
MVFLDKQFYNPVTTWSAFLMSWQRRGLLARFTLAAVKAVRAGVTTPAPLQSTIWALCSVVISRLLFFCMTRYVALSRQLRKILKNKYRFAKQLRFVSPMKRLQVTARFIGAFATVQDDSYRRPWRFINVLLKIANDAAHPLIESRNLQQKQTLAGLVTKQLRG